MSHFTVMVIGDDVKGQLAPYQEYDGDHRYPKKYLEFCDEEDAMREEYKTGAKDGKPFAEIYPTFEVFAKDWHGHHGPDRKTGRYGHWRNPNSKWDWYQVGGRWTGYFKVKEKPENPDDVLVGKAGIMTDPAAAGWADQLRKCDIDIEAMQREARMKAGEEYDKVAGATTGCPPAITFEAALARFPNDIDAAREFYRAQPYIAALRAAGLDPVFACPVTEYGCTRDEYLARAVRGALTPFALVLEGKWYERGKMGWFGSVRDEKSGDTWDQEFFTMFADLPGDTLVTAVDCHI